jgi:hypothetical protein
MTTTEILYPGTGRGTKGYAEFPETLAHAGGRWLRADLAAQGLHVSLMRLRRLLRDGRIKGRRDPIWYAEAKSIEAYRKRRDALVKLLAS